MSNLIFPIDVARYTTDTNHLTCEQDGAYWRILRKMWTEGGTIPNDERTLALICNVSIKRWRAISRPIMAMLIAIDGRLTQKRLANDLAQLAQAKSRAGKASGAARRASARGLSNAFDKSLRGVSQRHDVSDNQLELLNGVEQVFANARVRVDSTSLKEEITGKKIDSAKAESSKVIEAAVEAYSTLADKIGLPTVRALNDERQKKLTSILDQYGLPVWQEALGKIETSHFLRGDNDRGWTASFDFMLQPSSFLKLIEGRYNDRQPLQHAQSPPPSPGDEIDEMIRREREKELRNAKH